MTIINEIMLYALYKKIFCIKAVCFRRYTCVWIFIHRHNFGVNLAYKINEKRFFFKFYSRVTNVLYFNISTEW